MQGMSWQPAGPEISLSGALRQNGPQLGWAGSLPHFLPTKTKESWPFTPVGQNPSQVAPC